MYMYGRMPCLKACLFDILLLDIGYHSYSLRLRLIRSDRSKILKLTTIIYVEKFWQLLCIQSPMFSILNAAFIIHYALGIHCDQLVSILFQNVESFS